MTGLAWPGSGDDALLLAAPDRPGPCAGTRPGPPPPLQADPGTPAGDDESPAGTSDAERAAQREKLGRVQASYRRTRRGTAWRRQAARGTLPSRPGMIRKPPPGGDAA